MITRPVLFMADRATMQEAMISADAAPKSADAGQYAFDWRGAPKAFVVLTTGRLRVHFRTEDSPIQWAECRMAAGQDCMPLTTAILSREEIAIRATALTVCSWLEVSPPVFLRLVHRDQAFRAALFQSHARRLPGYLARVSAGKADRFDRRLAGWLLRHARSGAVRATHEDIASDLLTAREVVSRGLRAFAVKGWIVQQRGFVRLTAPAALMRLAKGRFSVSGLKPMVVR